MQYIFFYLRNFPDLIPHKAIKSIIDVTVLMVVVVEHAIRLPGLPPLRLESNSRVLHDSVIVRVKSQCIKRNCDRKMEINLIWKESRGFIGPRSPRRNMIEVRP